MSLECLDITLKDIVYHQTNANNPAGIPYLIGRDSRGKSVKGSMRKAVKGEKYRLWGEWRPQKGSYPPAFEFVHHEPVIGQSCSGFAHYLSTFVDGVGPVISGAIVNEFGADTLKILRETPEEAAKIKGVTPEIVANIKDHFSEHMEMDPVAYSILADLFKDHKFPKRLIKSLLKNWGSDAPAKVKEFPYVLLSYPRMGWVGVDAFATSPAIGYPPAGVDRHKFALAEAMRRVADEGHTVATRAEIETIAFALVGGLPGDDAWDAAFKDCLIVETGENEYSLPVLAEAEETIARQLAILADSARPLGFELPTDGLLAGQREAVRLFGEHGVCILAGPPGTGKSFTVARLLAALLDHKVGPIRVGAPTGKAAKRAAELIEAAIPNAPIKCTTVHKLLGPIPSEEPEGVPSGDSKVGRGRDAFSFSHNESNPIDAKVIVIDEFSMMDAELTADLLRAIAPGTLLLMVGDPNQLPSVGAGSVLRDLIAAGVPTATLTEVQRNCGTIVRACHDILAGKVPTPAKRANLAAGDNWIHVEIEDVHEIADKIVQLHSKPSETFHRVWDRQVISPEKGKEGVGCKNLNKLLSDALNEWKAIHPTTTPVNEHFAPPFVCGDKVVRTKNGFCDLMTLMDEDEDDRPDWTWGDQRYKLKQIDIVNGDMGDIVDIPTVGDNTYIVVDFVNPHRRCRLPYGNSHLIAAYAMTGHKCQGSGFPYVIIPVHDSFFYDARRGIGTWNREMIYTLASRAEKLLVTVGPRSAIESAVSRPSVGRRKTRLRGLVEMPSRMLGAIAESLMEVNGALASAEVGEYADV